MDQKVTKEKEGNVEPKVNQEIKDHLDLMETHLALLPRYDMHVIFIVWLVLLYGPETEANICNVL